MSQREMGCTMFRTTVIALTIFAVLCLPSITSAAAPSATTAAKRPSAQKPKTGFTPATKTSNDTAYFEKQLEALVKRVAVLENFNSSNHRITAEFDPTEPGPYQYIYSESGMFIVSLEDVVPYLDGQRVTLDIGNPMYAKYTGFKLHVSWS